MINLLDNEIYDITYIGIGSAVIRDANPENRQQFPPFIENIYNGSDLKIHVINIDPHFEKPYFLPTYINDLEKIDDNIFIRERLKITYINESVDIINNVESFDWFDTINKIVMDNNKLLICGIYTGYLCNIIENKFIKKYENSEYDEKYKKYITYDFFDIDANGCTCNLLKNFPIIDFKNKTILKFNNICKDNFITYNRAIEIDYSYENRIKKIMIKNFIEFIDYNHYVYRNLKNDNKENNIIKSIPFSIFNGNETKEELTEIFKLKLLEKYQFIEFLFSNNCNEIEQYIYYMENYNEYEWHNIVTQIIRNIHLF